MDVLEALRARHSVRDFLPTPVSKETVIRILEVATRSPSGGNGQPWELFVASGATMERIRTAYLERAQNQAGGPPPQPAGTPPPAFIRERMDTIRAERMRLLGLDPADPASGRVFGQWGARIYGAPTLVVVCMHQALSSELDLGMLVQSICLAALGYGVDSMISGSSVSHPDVLRKELGIPEEFKIVVGICLGYANPQSIINTYRSPRRPIEEVVRYRE